MVDGATLEMLCTATYRRFESCPLRQNPKIPHFMRDFLCFGGENRDEEVPCGSRVGGEPTYAEGLPLCGKRRYPVRYHRKTLTRILCGIFCVLAERTEIKGFLAVRVSALATYAEGLPLCGKRRYPVRYHRKTLTRILCGIFCVLAERTEIKGFLAVRVSALATYAEGLPLCGKRRYPVRYY